MYVGIVINPISGRGGGRAGEAARRRAFVESRAQAAGVNAVVVMTERRGHARALAQAFVDDQCDTVIAMGGDGTVNEVAQALVGTRTALGILPSGSGDGFARGLGVPADPDRAIRAALTAPSMAIDVGYAGGDVFLNILGVGFDAAVAREYAKRSTRGGAGYVTTGIRLLRTYVPPHYEVRWHTGAGEEVRSGRKYLVGFANAPTYGNGAVLAPDANLQDGLLDLMLVEAGAPVRQVWRARRLFWRHRQPAEGLERSRATRAIVLAETITYHLDGEPFETTGSLEVGVRPRALLVRQGLS